MISKILLAYTDILNGLIFDTVYESKILSSLFFGLYYAWTESSMELSKAANL